MHRIIASGAKCGLYSLGYYARRLRGDRFPGVAVLCYHGVRSNDLPAGSMPFEQLHVRAWELEQHCEAFRKFCHPITLGQWVSASAGGEALPDRPILLTFDDGYRNVLTVARTILERHQIPALVFVNSGPALERRLQWYDAVARNLGEAAVERIKNAPYADWLQQCQHCTTAARDDDPCALMTREELRRLAQSPLFEIGGHSVDHPILARCDRAEQQRQIKTNRTTLEAWIDRPVISFAYPNGIPDYDYTRDTVHEVQTAGYQMAFTTRHGFATDQESCFEKSRFMMLSGVSNNELAHRLACSWRR